MENQVKTVPVPFAYQAVDKEVATQVNDDGTITYMVNAILEITIDSFEDINWKE